LLSTLTYSSAILLLLQCSRHPSALPSFPTRRSSDLLGGCHRLAHFRRRPRHRVASQIHHAFGRLARGFDVIRIDPLIPLRHCIAHVFSLSSVSDSSGLSRVLAASLFHQFHEHFVRYTQ